MSTQTPVAPTVGEIARRFGVEIHKIEHIIRSRDIKPIARAGNAMIYSEEAVAFIGQELQRIEAGKAAVRK